MHGQGGKPMHGHVKQVRLDRGFAFGAFAGGIEAFIPMHALDSTLPFDETLQGREVVAYVSETNDGKYRARGVRAAY